MTLPAPISRITPAASLTPASDVASTPERIPASSLLGVATVDSGIRHLFRSGMADCRISIPPVVDLITGSVTIGAPLPFRHRCSIMMFSEFRTIPIFTPSISKSSKMQLICSASIAPETASALPNLVVFWLVTAVTAVRQWAPSPDSAATSAWIPAPDDGSDPPMDRIFMRLF